MRVLLFLLATSTLLQCTSRTQESQPEEQRAPMTPIPHPSLTDFDIEPYPLRPWYEAIAAADDFISLDPSSAALSKPMRSSLFQCDWFLAPEFDPHNRSPGLVDWSVHVAHPGGVDLLRATDEVDGLDVRLLANVNFTRVDIRPHHDSPYADKPAQFLDYVAESIIHSGSPKFHEWIFDIPKDVILPFRIANVGAVEVREIKDRRERLDIMLSHGVAHIQYYNKIHQYLNYLPADDWFNADARRQFSGASRL